MAYLTAWIPLTRQVVIHPGARVLVHAAAGGVGSAAVVVARDLGAEVVATAGSADKLALPLSLGASAGGHLRPARRDRAGRRRLRPGRRPAVRRLDQAPAAARRRDRDRLRRRALAADRPGAPRRAQRRRPGLLSRPADAAASPTSSARRRPTCCGSGTPGRCARSSARRSRSPRRRRPIAWSRAGARPERSCSSRESARHRRRGRARRGDGRAARGRGLRGRRPRSHDRLRRHRPRPVGRGRAGRRRLPQRGHSRRQGRSGGDLARALPAGDGGQRRRRRPRRQAPRSGDALGRPDRGDRVARRPHRDAGRSGLRRHEARGRRLRPQRRAVARASRDPDQRRSAPASPTRRCSPAPSGSGSTLPASR